MSGKFKQMLYGLFLVMLAMSAGLIGNEIVKVILILIWWWTFLAITDERFKDR